MTTNSKILGIAADLEAAGRHEEARVLREGEPETRAYVVQGPTLSSSEAVFLVEASQWFEVTPPPDDVFRFTVKRDALDEHAGDVCSSCGLAFPVTDLLDVSPMVEYPAASCKPCHEEQAKVNAAKAAKVARIAGES